ncbi:Aromatic/aminoadipate aminotransferase 1 [Savitreella phatthalungensis]
MTMPDVSAELAAFEPPAREARTSVPKAKDMTHHLSEESKARRPSPLKEASLYLKNPNLLSLGGGLPSPSSFPFNAVSADVPAPGLWNTDVHNTITIPRFADNADDTLELARYLQYGQGSGQTALLDFMTEHTRIVHNPQYEDWSCMMTAGNTHAIDTVFRMFLNRGEYFFIEEFSFPSVYECAHPQGLLPIPLKLDDEGIMPEYFESVLSGWDPSARGGANRPHVLYTIPTGQNPTGANASLERRRAILDICSRYDILLIEDDPYYFLFMDKFDLSIPLPSSHLDLDGPTNAADFLASLPPSYLSLDVEGRVVRLDSLSKVLAPGLRCGWLSGSNALMERALRSNEVGIQAPSGLAQAFVLRMWRLWGHHGYLHWLANLRKSYTLRRNALLHAIHKHLPPTIASFTPPHAGMFVWIHLDHLKHPHYPAKSVAQLEKEIFMRCVMEDEVLVAQGSWFIIREAGDTGDLPGLFFRATFAAAPLDKMDEAMRRFGRAITKAFALTSTDTPTTSAPHTVTQECAQTHASDPVGP